VRSSLAAPASLLLALALTACSGKSGDDTASPFTDCSAITAASSGPTDLPDLSLPCFTGGKQIALTSIRGPAVINLWASWCGPCRTELPVIQRLAEQQKGRLTVVGVDTGDRREAGASFAADKQVTMPTLFDADSKLSGALSGRGLPMTVFVDAQGKRTVYLLPLTEDKLAEQVKAHTGVVIK
jgi:cytochrome c biogenesis protein CcmG/thiol:disulfide interchange protein DsbE